MIRQLLLFSSLLISSWLCGQTDFFGHAITGQSPNSVSVYVVGGITNETSFVSNAANLQEFEHASRQINLFNLGISYAAQVLELDSVDDISINLDTVVGGGFTKNSFRLHAGLQYELFDREASSYVLLGSSRFRDGGISMAVRQDISLLREGRAFELIPAMAMDQSVFVSFHGGLEAGFDSGFSISLEESGILQITTDHLVRDVAAGKLTFEEYKLIEGQLHESLRYQAPKNTGGSEWYLLALVKGEVYSQPFINVPVQFSVGMEFGLDVTRIRKRNQNRFSLSLGVAYLLY